MLKSEIQQQYWITKKAVQRKFGSKEDECIISSDAELDSKIELFNSISECCARLHRCVDSYQERIYVLAQEETALGKFLKETGKGSETCGKLMSTAGKALLYSGQQRMQQRAPLLRLHHEVETFRGCAVIDCLATIQTMERERTEYRAALAWMKSASQQLDPDTGRGLEKFRKAQSHVRNSKQKFDRYTLDCLQKIDLLAAARCNMFSHGLVAYQSALIRFTSKTLDVYRSAIKTLEKSPQYSFQILKELTQNNGEPQDSESVPKDELDDSQDADQLLFFKDEYKDDSVPTPLEKLLHTSENQSEPIQSEQLNELLDLSESLIPTDLSKSLIDDQFGDFMSSTDVGAVGPIVPPSYMPSQLLLASSSIIPSVPSQLKSDRIVDMRKIKSKEQPVKERVAWFKLFADLDPLAKSTDVSDIEKTFFNDPNSQHA